MLDEKLLREAIRVSGGKSFSETINLALKDLVRRAKAQQIFDLAGKGLWEGDLAEMREDNPRR